MIRKTNNRVISHNIKVSFFLLLCLEVLFIIDSAICIGNEIVVTPTLIITETYNDNIYLSFTDQQEDIITTVTPLLDLDVVTEKFKLDGTAQFDINKHNNEEFKDTTKDSYDFYSDIGLQYDSSQLFSLRFDASYIIDSSIDSEIEKSGFRINDRRVFDVMPNFTLWVSEKNVMKVSSGYEYVSYEDPSYIDFDAYFGLVELGRAISSERGILFFGSGYGLAEGYIDEQAKPGNVAGGIISNTNYIFGFDINSNPNWLFQLRCGNKAIKIEYKPYLLVTYPSAGKVYNGQHESLIGNFTLSRLYEKGSISAKIIRDIVQSGESMVIDKTTGQISTTYHFSEYFSSDVFVSWSGSKSLSENLQTDTELFTFICSGEYQFLENISGIIAYHYANTKDKTDGTNAVRNKLSIKIKGHWDKIF